MGASSARRSGGAPGSIATVNAVDHGRNIAGVEKNPPSVYVPTQRPRAQRKPVSDRLRLQTQNACRQFQRDAQCAPTLAKH